MKHYNALSANGITRSAEGFGDGDSGGGGSGAGVQSLFSVRLFL